jgi:hypothetical protein
MPEWVVRGASRPAVPGLTLAFLTMVVFQVAVASPEQTGQPPVDQTALLTELKSPKWAERSKAVHAAMAIPGSKLTPEIMGRILDLYASELERRNKAAQGLLPESDLKVMNHEAYAEYIGELETLLMRIGGDRALRLVIESPSQAMADSNRQLAAYGVRILPMVLTRINELRTLVINTPGYHGPDFQDQEAMADILGQMLLLDQEHRLKPTLTTADYTKIRSLLRSLLSSPDEELRFYAAVGLALGRGGRDADRVRGVFSRRLQSNIPIVRIITLEKLAQISDPSFIPLAEVRRLARSDPYNSTFPGGAFKGPYPIRQQAASILRKFPPGTASH